MGWAGLKNGELLERAGADFDVLLTVDRGIQHQQNLARARIAVVLMVAPSNDIAVLRPLVPKVLARLAGISPGEIVRIE